MIPRPDSTASGSGPYTNTRSLAEVPSPASSLLLVENPRYVGATNWGFGNEVYFALQQQMYNEGQGPNWYDQTGLDDAKKPANKPIHSNGWNYGFADGHVKWYRPEATVGPNNTAAMQQHVRRPWVLDPGPERLT